MRQTPGGAARSPRSAPCLHHKGYPRRMPDTGETERSTPKPDTTGSIPADSSSSALRSGATVPLKRRLVLPAVVLGALELLAVAYPVWVLFDLASLGADTLLRTALPVCIVAAIVWWATTTAWLFPL